MIRQLLLVAVFVSMVGSTQAQEIQAKLTVVSARISTQVNKNIFQTLQTALTNFLNNRKWTPDTYQPNEKIQCNFLLNLEQDLGNNVYKGKLTIQAARPVFNTTYDSPLLNFIDDDITFRYIEFQPIEFNENRVQGNDPLVANLPAVLAYYVNIILGMDYDSYSLRGGANYFQKSWNIVNNAPEGSDINGWKSFDKLRNRYWLAENLNNTRFALMHDAIYAYYRSGLDQFFEKEDEARAGILSSLNYLNTINTENPNSMILQVFFQGKSNEMVRIFKKGNSDTRTRAYDLLTKVDLMNTSTYKELK